MIVELETTLFARVNCTHLRQEVFAMYKKIKAIVCANSIVYLASEIDVHDRLCRVAVRMNMRTQKYVVKWWYKYDDKDKLFEPDSEDEYLNAVLYGLQEELFEEFNREFLLAQVSQWREK